MEEYLNLFFMEDDLNIFVNGKQFVIVQGVPENTSHFVLCNFLHFLTTYIKS